MELVGVIRCPLSCLVPYGEGRQIDDRIVDRLVRRYRKATCDSENKDHHIQGIITYADLDGILSSLRLSRDGLRDTSKQNGYPLLSSHNIAYFRGRHRIAAATILDQNAAWVVQLHCVKANWVTFPATLDFDSPQRESYVQDEVEFSSCESAYSDGEIYRLFCKYTAVGDATRAAEIRSRLTPCKETSLNGFLKRRDLVTALDALLEFPGMLGGLQLGNIHKHLALHADEHIKRNFQYIYTAWSTITDGNPQIKQCVDFVTIRALQFRAPLASASDRSIIRQLFEDRIVFSRVTDAQTRKLLEERILRLDIVVPSIETFHENMKLISIGVHVLRDLVLEKKAHGKRKLSLYQSLSLDWRIPTEPIMEIEEGVLRRMPNTDFQICYLQLFLATIRHFPRLSSTRPRQDSRGEPMSAFVDDHQTYLLLKLASDLGFENSRIRGSLDLLGHSIQGTIPTASKGKLAQWRCGRPFARSYISLRTSGFLPTVLQSPVRADVPSPTFILRDMLQAFFCDLASIHTLDSAHHEADLAANKRFSLPRPEQRVDDATVHSCPEVFHEPTTTHSPTPEQQGHHDELTAGQLSAITEIEDENVDMADAFHWDPSESSQSKPQDTSRTRLRKERRWAMVPRRGKPSTPIPSFAAAASNFDPSFNFTSPRRRQGINKATMPSLNDRRTLLLSPELLRNLAVSNAVDTAPAQYPNGTPSGSPSSRPNNPALPALDPARTTVFDQELANVVALRTDNGSIISSRDAASFDIPTAVTTEVNAASGTGDELVSEELLQRRSSTGVPPIRRMKRQREVEPEDGGRLSIQIRRISGSRPVKVLRLDLDAQAANTWRRRSAPRSPLRGRTVPGNDLFPVQDNTFQPQPNQGVLPTTADVTRPLEGAWSLPQGPEEEL